ncbi:MAG: hypothetical protein V1756_00395 [Patescibacteria group bacterium]
MIPLVSVSNLATLPFLIFICIRFFISFQKREEKNIAYFFIVFLLVTAMEILLASPGLIFEDPADISTVFAFYPFLVFLSLGFLAAIPFSIMRMKKTEIFFIVLMFVTSISTTIINLNNVLPSPTINQPPFIYWEDTRGPEMNIFIGIASGLIFLFVILFFFIQGFKNQDKYVRTRSFLIGAGLIIFLVTAAINFTLGAILKQNITSIVSAFLVVVSSFILFLGIRYKKTTQEVSYPESKERNHPKIQW